MADLWSAVVKAGELNAGLALVNRAVPTRTTLPVLRCILVRVLDDRLLLSGTDLETAITTTVPAEASEPGALAVMAANFVDYLGTLPAGEVALHVKEGVSRLHLDAGTIRAEFAYLPADEFPALTTMGDCVEMAVDGEALVAALDKVLFAASTDESHPILTGIHLTFVEDRVIAEAADGFRMSKTTLTSSPVGDALEMIVPARPLSFLKHLAPKTLRMGLRRHQDGGVIRGLVFTDGTTTVEAPLIDGSFPNVDRVIPTSHKIRVVMERTRLKTAVRRAMIFARESANIVTLEINERRNQITVGASGQGDDGKTTLDGQVEGMVGPDLFSIGFNGRFLEGAIGAVDTDNLVMDFNAQTNPMALRELDGDPNYIHVIMPMHLGR